MQILEIIKDKSRNFNRRIVLPETDDPRVLQAAQMVVEYKSSRLVLLGSEGELKSAGYPVDHPDIEVRNWDSELEKEPFLNLLIENLGKKGLTRNEADSMLTDRLIYAGSLVALGKADGAVAGSVAATASVIRAGLRTIGIHPDSKLVSSLFLMTLKQGRTVTYSDCGVVPFPDTGQLASIGIDAGTNHQRLTGQEPRIAFLSFSTHGSAGHESAEKVRKAAEIAQKLRPKWRIDGEIQFDAAWSPEIADRKAPGSPLEGQANVFVFPNLDAGNIAYKITERVAGALATGPIIQGLNKPYMDLSRGCSAADIAHSVHVASVMGE